MAKNQVNVVVPPAHAGMIREIAKRLRENEAFASNLADFLAGLEMHVEGASQARPDASTFGERLDQLERDIRAIQDTESADARNVWHEINRLAERVAALEDDRQARPAPASDGKAKASDQRQDAPSTVPKVGNKASKLKPDQEAAARIMAEIEASGVQLVALGPSGDPAGRRLTKDAEATAKRLRKEAGLSYKEIGRRLGISENTAKRAVKATD